MEEKIESLRKAAEIHRNVRHLVKDDIKPGVRVRTVFRILIQLYVSIKMKENESKSK